MRRNVKSLGMVAFTACVLVLPLLAATPAQAQSYSLTCSFTVGGGSGPAPDGGGQGNVLAQGTWSTVPGDTVKSITVYYSTNGVNFTPVTVPNTNITGVGGPGGTYSVLFSLPSGKYIGYGVIETVLGDKVASFKSPFTVP